MKIQIKSNERIFITGRTGSGKSVLINQLLLPGMNHVVLYDYKHEIEYPGAVIFQSMEDFKRKPNEPFIIYRSQTGTDEEFDRLCRQCFYRGNNTLVLDEVAQHCNKGLIQPYHDLIMRLGRSKGVGIVNCTQRPRGIHNNILSQCEHFFIFDLIQETDRKKMAEFCGDEVMARAKNYTFWYYEIHQEKAVLCKPLSLKNKGLTRNK